MSSDNNLLLGLDRKRKEVTNIEKIAGEYDLLLGLGDGEDFNDQLTRTHGGLMRDGWATQCDERGRPDN